jgi:hypothetical protein
MITLMSITESQRLLTQVREENVGGESYGQALQRLFIVMPLAPVCASAEKTVEATPVACDDTYQCVGPLL